MSVNDQMKDLLAEAHKTLDRAAKAYTEALIAVARLEAQRDQLFMATGDKTLVDEKIVR